MASSPATGSSATSENGASRGGNRATVAAIGLMLFSMFFGAGNLIFPPILGVESGEHFTPAIIGFLLTAVALPALTVIAVAISGSGVKDLASRAGVVFGLVFSVVAYLSIGSFYALPRAAAIGYELGIETTLNLSGSWWRLLFTSLFFAVTFAIVLVPGKVADTLGKVLTPVLLILLAVLAVVTISTLDNPPAPATPEYENNALVSGALQGYFTMDSIAALAFAIIVVSTFGSTGITEHRTVVKLTAISAGIAAVFLLFVYVALGVMGTRMPDKGSYSDGAELLSTASELSLGTAGSVVFSGVVLLACLTTAVGLIAASAAFFNELVPRVAYRTWAIIFTLIGLVIANLGLERILSISGPVIGLIYPPAIALIAITVSHLLMPKLRLPYTYRTAVYTALVFSTVDFFQKLGWEWSALSNLLSHIPLFNEGLGWLIPTVITSLIAVAVDLTRGRKRREPLVSGEIDESLHSEVSASS